ncbi:MAG: hypothetical protein HKL90_08225 [Elusimicrobia bacterium]|nr:hypothetical protein [Elusimicrobiota bacterium]
MALLLSAIIATAVMSVALTAKMNGGQNGKNDRHEIAGQAVKNVSAALRSFVSGCCDVSADCKAFSPATPYTCWPLHGPNTAGADGGWTFNGYAMASGVVGDPSYAGRYALLSGTHMLTNVLPAWFTAAPYNAQLSYKVDASAGVGVIYSLPATYPSTPVMPQVNISVTWTEPASP